MCIYLYVDANFFCLTVNLVSSKLRSFVDNTQLYLKCIVLFLTVIKRQAVNLSCSTEARSCNHCFSEKAIRISYSECVFLA